jgi:hypothetical protein
MPPQQPAPFAQQAVPTVPEQVTVRVAQVPALQ